MLVVITSCADLELDLFKSQADTAIVVPAHWSLLGSGADARLVTSKGTIPAGEVSGVLTRTQRAWPAALLHINEEDREYVASEMTAFLAALLYELPCPVFNRPAGNSLAAQSPGSLAGQCIAYVDPNPKRSYLLEWNISVQQQLMAGVVGTLGYIG